MLMQKHNVTSKTGGLICDNRCEDFFIFTFRIYQIIGAFSGSLLEAVLSLSVWAYFSTAHIHKRHDASLMP